MSIAPPPTPAGPALDPDTFDGLMDLVDGDDDGFVVDLFEAYISSVGACVEGMRTALAEGDAHALSRHAHTLKGASANVGAIHVANLARALQMMGEQGSIDGAEDWIRAIVEEYSRVIEAVSGRLPSFSA